ncbi:MAG: FkbM family methyltransferase [Chthoniobacter sp.]|nr:FkbM family methyltransferase [Chthoniobacter sp.]
MNLIRSIKDLRHSLFYAAISSRNHKTVTLGDKWTWTIDPSTLTPKSVVYSAGVGDDISFEKQLVQEYGCEVILLDPSPTGVQTMSHPDNQHPKLKFEQAGLSDRDGTITLGVPDDPTGDSYFMTSSSERILTVPCWSLPTIMRNHGHSSIDLLKMDIEGFEYGVLTQICQSGIAVRQICVEFHHSIIAGITRSQTIGAILALRKIGYRLIHRKDWDHTFLKE